MTHTAQSIEEIFTRKAWVRASQNIEGDAGYWTGGRCDYGGAHNLREDCQTLAKFFDDTTELKNAQKDLINFNSREEFEKNKQNLLSKTNQAINGLSVRTGSSTYVGGVCIIWEDFSEFLDSIISDFRKEIESLKRDIENAQYEEAQELALIEQREAELKQEIEENQKKAASETDPDKKKKFIFLADQAKEEWEKLLEKKKKLKISNLGNDFNPSRHINDFIKSIENSLGGGNTPKRDPFKNSNTNGSGGGSGSGTGRKPNPQDPFQPNQNSFPNFFQTNKTLILIAVVALLAIFYFYSQKEKEPNYYDF